MIVSPIRMSLINTDNFTRAFCPLSLPLWNHPASWSCLPPPQDTIYIVRYTVKCTGQARLYLYPGNVATQGVASYPLQEPMTNPFIWIGNGIK